MRIRRALTTTGLAGLAFAAAASDARGQVPEWKLREELRVTDAPRVGGRLPRVGRLVVGPEGRVYAAAANGDVHIFDRRGKPLAAVRIPAPEAVGEMLRERAREKAERQSEVYPREPGPETRIVASSRPDMEAAPSMGWIGDTVWLVDRLTGNLTLLDRAGDSTWTLSYVPTITGEPANMPLALLADGSLLRTITPGQTANRRRRLMELRPPSVPERYRMPVFPSPPVPEMPVVPVAPATDAEISDEYDRGYLVRVTPDGRVLQGLEIFLDGPQEATLRNQYGETAIIQLPFRDDPLITATPDGREVVFVERYRATGPGPASYAVVRFDVATGNRRARRYEYAPARTDEALDSVVKTWVEGPGSPLDRRFIQGFATRAAAGAALRAALQSRAWHVPVTHVVAGADHSVWLREHAGGRWIVLGRDGSVLGRVSLPDSARLVHVDGETAWAAFDQPVGAADAPVLVRYRVVKP